MSQGLPTPPAIGPNSITARLAISVAAAVTTVLLAITVPLYVGLKHELEHSHRQAVLDELDVLRAVDRGPATIADELDEEIRQETSNHQHMRYYARVVADSDAPKSPTLIETRDMSVVVPVSVFSDPAPVGHQPETHDWISAKTERRYLLMAARAPWKFDEARPVLQLALDVTSADALLAGYRHRLMLLLGLGLVVSMALAWYLARRSLRPLTAITRAAELITAEQLDERLGQQTWPAELVALSSAFDTMLARLDESFRHLAQFSADLAHELRTPINNLMGQTEVALSQQRSSAEYRRVLVSNLEELERLGAITENLLFLARADTTKLAINPETLEAAEVLTDARQLFEAVAEHKHIELTCHGRATLWADPMLVRRALSNLLDNAVEHTGQGGQIELRAKTTDDAVELVVRDDGAGIAAQHLPHVRERLYRADPSRSDARGSSGLGLAIVDSIMARHGGVLMINSAPGNGTEVSLTFPARQAC